jgi:hypothetical protein
MVPFYIIAKPHTDADDWFRIGLVTDEIVDGIFSVRTLSDNQNHYIRISYIEGEFDKYDVEEFTQLHPELMI